MSGSGGGNRKPADIKRQGVCFLPYDCLRNPLARTMLANSEYLLLLNQAPTDRAELAKLLNISETQMSYITNAEHGRGLVKVGGSLVPFINEFPQNTRLYNLMTTRPGEG